MSIRILIQLGLASILLIISAGAAWYEGSEILDDPWEWKYTAIFSQKVNGQVEYASDILPIDHFVYAAKFVPTFPLLMLLSGTYLIVLLGYILLKRSHKMFSYFLSCFGILFMVISSLLSKSPTIGLKIFFNSFLLIGMLLIVIAMVKIFTNKIEDVC